MPEFDLKYPAHFDREALLKCGHGGLFGPGNARLPLPPMLMMDRILEITTTGGKYDKGYMIADLDVNPDLWFFECHFENDPVMPGCLGLDALWQMVGFYLGWLGKPGIGRALGVGEVKFTNQVLPTSKKVVYRVDFKKLILRSMTMGIGDGTVHIDGVLSYECNDLKVGLFNAETTSAKPL